MIWSKSKIKLYRNCPFAWKLRYVDKIEQEFVEALDKGTKLHDLFDKYYLTEDLEQTKKDIMFPEVYVGKYGNHIQNFLDWIKIYPNKPYIREEKQTVDNITGIVDRIDQISEDEFIVIDYKTSTGTNNIQEYLDELLLYAYLANKKFHLNVTKVAIYFSGNNKFVVEPVTKEMIQKNWDDFQEEIKLYEEAIELEMFEPRKGVHCNWCGFKDKCPLYKR